MVYGDNRLYNVALVVPDPEATKKWAADQGLSFDSTEKMLADPRVREHIKGEVDKYSAEFKGFERVKKVALSAEDFTVENGLLTATLKLKRRAAIQKFGPQIDALYSDDAAKSKAASAEA